MIKVLIIEDKDVDLKILDEVLSAEDFALHFSHEKQDGIEIALRYHPNLILFSYTGLHDLLYLDRIIKNELTSDLPIILLSDQANFEEQRMLMEKGIDDYIPLKYIPSSLLKSIRSRLDKIKRIKNRFNEQLNSFEENGKQIKQDDHLLVKLGRKLKFIKFSDIVCITALKEYSKIKTNENLEVIVRKSMQNWIKVLPEKSFLRIHRATIINLEYIDKISQKGNRTYCVSLKGINEPFSFSFRYTNIMRRSFPS